jgi:formylglycine-generating enzyme required for sulfatase activity/uncharacterized protein YcgL (UPF0745 family)
MSENLQKILLTIILLMTCGFVNAQVKIQSSVWDAQTLEPISYCQIAIKHSNESTIANSDGKFVLYTNIISDSLIVFSMGYQKKAFALKDITEETKIYLQPQAFELLAITISANNDYIYDIVSKCRGILQKNKSKYQAKVYYGLNTTRDDIPVEVLECYFNGNIKGIIIEKLLLKNGKVGLKNKDSLVFLSYNLSQLVSAINLTENSKYYPQLPFHFNKKQLKKNYYLSCVFLDNYYRISFRPHNDNNKFFSGNMWIEKGTNNLIKLDLEIDSTNVHPLIPSEKINNLSLKLSYTFDFNGKNIVLSHVNFKYSLDYKYYISEIIQDSVMFAERSTNVNTTGLVYCYDYDNPFILPYFNYGVLNDYQKLSYIPYNHLFWENRKLLLSEEQVTMLQSMDKSGLTFNSDSATYGKNFMKNVIGDASSLLVGQPTFIFWDSNDRIEISKEYETPTYNPYHFFYRAYYSSIAPPKSDLYNLSYQIFLDIIAKNDTNYCTSYSIINAAESFTRVPEEVLMQVFANIYFDIVEIERRKMQDNFDANNFTLKQIEEIYYATLNKIDEVVFNLFNDEILWINKVAGGVYSDLNKLRKWNKYVYENLGINNMLVFQKKQGLENEGFLSLNPIEPEMIEVKGSTFNMGCHDDGFDWEFPVHKVKVSSFKISKYLVTQKQWMSVMGSNPSYFKGEDLPVENVSWLEVQEFITKLNEATGKNYRLPTENEWEYAARGGNKSKNYKYSGNNLIDEVAWYAENSNGTTHPVGTKKSNELGIYDMSGNVMEWCHDVSEVYVGASVDFPIDLEHIFRVLRGGGWKSKLEFCRVYSRNRSPQEFSREFCGFRLVLP